MTHTSTETQWGEIDGCPITFPMEVEDLDSATMLLTVPADAAQALLPGEDFEVIATDGTAQMVISCCDYHRNPWGEYLEINLGFLARPVGAGDGVIGSFIFRMPVDQAFTCRAGNEVMGFPKTLVVRAGGGSRRRRASGGVVLLVPGRRTSRDPVVDGDGHRGRRSGQRHHRGRHGADRRRTALARAPEATGLRRLGDGPQRDLPARPATALSAGAVKASARRRSTPPRGRRAPAG